MEEQKIKDFILGLLLLLAPIALYYLAAKYGERSEPFPQSYEEYKSGVPEDATEWCGPGGQSC